MMPDIFISSLYKQDVIETGMIPLKRTVVESGVVSVGWSARCRGEVTQ